MTYKNILLMAGCALYAAVQAQVTIDIDAQQRGPKVSPMLYGIFYEDINHAADGGMEENTLDTPTAIHPVEQLLSPENGSILLDVPPYSLNIVRIK